VNAVAVQAFPCHLTIPQHSAVAFDDPRVHLCAGAALFLNNQLAISRNLDMAAFQKQLEDVSQTVKGSVFQWPSEFNAHHGVNRLEAVREPRATPLPYNPTLVFAWREWAGVSSSWAT